MEVGEAVPTLNQKFSEKEKTSQHWRVLELGALTTCGKMDSQLIIILKVLLTSFKQIFRYHNQVWVKFKTKPWQSPTYFDCISHSAGTQYFKPLKQLSLWICYCKQMLPQVKSLLSSVTQNAPQKAGPYFVYGELKEECMKSTNCFIDCAARLSKEKYLNTTDKFWHVKRRA